jgi:hypothetical protein
LQLIFLALDRYITNANSFKKFELNLPKDEILHFTPFYQSKPSISQSSVNQNVEKIFNWHKQSKFTVTISDGHKNSA